MLDSLIERGFQVEFHSHARSILDGEFPDAIKELEEVLLGATIPIEEIIGSGGGSVVDRSQISVDAGTAAVV